MAGLRSQRVVQGVHRCTPPAPCGGVQTNRCGDNQPRSCGSAPDSESVRASMARRGCYADLVGNGTAHPTVGEQKGAKAISPRLVRAATAVQRAEPSLEARGIVQGQHRNEREGGLPAPVGLGTTRTGTRYARNQKDRIRIAGLADQEQGSPCCCPERHCITDRGRRSWPASDLRLRLGGSEGPAATFLSAKQLRVASRAASGIGPVPR